MTSPTTWFIVALVLMLAAVLCAIGEMYSDHCTQECTDACCAQRQHTWQWRESMCFNFALMFGIASIIAIVYGVATLHYGTSM